MRALAKRRRREVGLLLREGKEPKEIAKQLCQSIPLILSDKKWLESRQRHRGHCGVHFSPVRVPQVPTRRGIKQLLNKKG